MFSTDTINRLRISRPPPSPVEIVETRKALDKGRFLIGYSQQVRLTLIVWELMKEAMETHKRIPDREWWWLSAAERASWPTVCHTQQEMWAADTQRLVDLKMSKEEPPLPRIQNNDPTAMSRMMTVLSWLKFIDGRRIPRDKAIFMALASGASPQWVRNTFMRPERSDRAVYAVKEKCCRQIAQAIKPYVDFSFNF